MRPQKPDRWERIASENSLGKGENKFFYARDLAYYLRKEHAWVRRMIKAQYKHGVSPGSVNFGYNQAVEFFLDQLKWRAK